MKYYLILFLISQMNYATARNSTDEELASAIKLQSAPKELWSLYNKAYKNKTPHLAPTEIYYELLNPFFLQGDYDGDNKIDFAVILKTKKIAVLLGNGHKFEINIEDKEFYSNTKFKAWRTATKGQMVFNYEGTTLKTDSIEIHVGESTYRLIYWNGKKIILGSYI